MFEYYLMNEFQSNTYVNNHTYSSAVMHRKQHDRTLDIKRRTHVYDVVMYLTVFIIRLHACK